MLSHITIFLVALFQGLMIVLFPAAALMLTDSSYHNLTRFEYGALFIPLIVGIILSSRKAHLFGLREVLCFGLIFIFLSQVFFLMTYFVLKGSHSITFLFLLLALFSLGIGYGAGLTAINAYIPKFFPNKTATALSALYTFSGSGSALAPLLFHTFFVSGFWWLAPLSLGGIALILAYLSQYLPDLEQKKGKD